MDEKKNDKPYGKEVVAASRKKGEKTTLLDYAAEIEEFATKYEKTEVMVKRLSDMAGTKITKDMLLGICNKMFGSYEIRGLCAGHKRRVAEYLIMRCRLGYDISMDMVRNLDKVRETGGMLIEIMKLALTDLALSGKPSEILKYIPQSVWQDYFLAGISGGKGVNEGIDKLMMQLPIVAGAEERKSAEDEKPVITITKEGEITERRGILDDLLE